MRLLPSKPSKWSQSKRIRFAPTTLLWAIVCSCSQRYCSLANIYALMAPNSNEKWHVCIIYGSDSMRIYCRKTSVVCYSERFHPWVSMLQTMEKRERGKHGGRAPCALCNEGKIRDGCRTQDRLKNMNEKWLKFTFHALRITMAIVVEWARESERNGEGGGTKRTQQQQHINRSKSKQWVLKHIYG